jgi:hypothetical protein
MELAWIAAGFARLHERPDVPTAAWDRRAMPRRDGHICVLARRAELMGEL